MVIINNIKNKEDIMAECECLPGCGFYHDKMPIESGIGNLYKKNYCLGDNSECARHMVFKKLGREAVPANLYPNQLDKAKKIIENSMPQG